MASTQLWQLGASELADGIRKRSFSSVEVVTAHLARIEAVNPAVRAVTRVLGDEALASARDADERLARGDDPGPLHGVPFTVKENIDVAHRSPLTDLTAAGLTGQRGMVRPSTSSQAPRSTSKMRLR